jgi:hypothetical protein
MMASRDLAPVSTRAGWGWPGETGDHLKEKSTELSWTGCFDNGSLRPDPLPVGIAGVVATGPTMPAAAGCVVLVSADVFSGRRSGSRVSLGPWITGQDGDWT